MCIRDSVLAARNHFFIAIREKHTFCFKVCIFSQNPVAIVFFAKYGRRDGHVVLKNSLGVLCFLKIAKIVNPPFFEDSVILAGSKMDR